MPPIYLKIIRLLFKQEQAEYRLYFKDGKVFRYIGPDSEIVDFDKPIEFMELSNRSASLSGGEQIWDILGRISPYWWQSFEDGGITNESDSSNEEDQEFVFPDSDSVKLTLSDLKGLDNKTLRIARNEIVARHGRIFGSGELQRYFDSKSWYEGTIPSEEFDANLMDILNEIEHYNFDYIRKVENQRRAILSESVLQKVEDALDIQTSDELLYFVSEPYYSEEYANEEVVNVDFYYDGECIGNCVVSLDGSYISLLN